MELRKLKLADAPYMLEWMHDETVVGNMNRDFSSYALKDCEEFILDSLNNENNIHLAIVDDKDEYLGTVSLKNIDRINNCAEFGITIRKVAMGKSVSATAMQEIIKIGIDKIKLEKIYWCVSPNNVRAVKFYDKNNYKRIKYSELGVETCYSKDLIDKYIWYCV